MKILTAGQMMSVDRTTIEHGTPGIELMRNAADAVCETIQTIPGTPDNPAVVVIAGKGNNGGDGFRVAYLLDAMDYDVSIYLVGIKDDVKDDAKTCLDEAIASGIPVVEVSGEEELAQCKAAVVDADVVVDALFGTGLTGEPRETAAQVIDIVNECALLVVAVDIPSGVNASTGEAGEHAIAADYTVTFGAMKVGHVLMPGKRLSGAVTVADIGFLQDVLKKAEAFGYVLTDTEASEMLPRRWYDAHKGSVGRVFLLAGSVGLTGAATLAASATMRVGAGMATVGCPESLNDILEVKLTEIMTLPLPEVRRRRCLSLRALGMIRESVKRADVVAVGPGLGAHPETSELVRRFIMNHTGEIVLDADGINAFKGNAAMLKDAPGEIVLTPHPGELSRLLDIPVADIQSDRMGAVAKAAEITGCTVLLKGAPTLIADSSGSLWINPTGNEGMATAGMGDVLTGVIAGLAAQGLGMSESAVLGAYIHGLAGEAASRKLGIHGVMAGDVVNFLPEILIDLD